MTSNLPVRPPVFGIVGCEESSELPVASAGNMRVGNPGGSIGPTSDSSFTIHYSNIRGLASNFSSVEHHIATTLPNILLLSETQLSNTVSTDSYQISHYNFLPHFRFKGGVCAYFNINTPVARLTDLESSDFDVLWLKICLSTSTTFLCFSYCSLAHTDYAVFFNYLTSCHESVLSSHPSAEVIYLGDFNVHHSEWLGSSSTDVGGEHALSFSILNDLEQIIRHPTRVPDRHDYAPNPLDLFFTSNPLNYNYSISAPLGSSDHSMISVSSSMAPPPPIPLLNANFGTMRMHNGLTCVNSFMTFPGMTIASLHRIQIKWHSVQRKYLSLEWKHTSHLLSNLSLRLSRGLIAHVPLLLKQGTVHIGHGKTLVLLLLILHLFMLGIVANVLYVRPSIALYKRNVMT